MSFVLVACSLFDKDESGFIDGEEIRTMLNAFHCTDFSRRDVDRMIDQCDQDGDGEINFLEFVGIIRAGLRPSSR